MSELDVGPRPDAEAVSEPDAAPDPEAEAATEPEPEAATEPEPEAATEPEPEPEAATEPEPEAATEPEPEAATEPEPEAVAEPEPEPPDAEVGVTETGPEATEGAGTPVVEPAGPTTVGRFIADSLRAAGVRYAFTVPGESFLGVLDALGEAGIRVVATRHEGAAAFMAEAHGQLTGRPAACLATRAVGGGNLAIGIHTARQDSSPVFALVGQVPRAFRGREAFQEIDQVATLGGLAKWAAEPRTADEVPGIMAQAVREALSGRPGPVWLSLPEDLLDEITTLEPADGPRPVALRATPDEIRTVIERLASAERPVILAGAGILRARTSTELLRFAELLHVPVVAAWRRGDVVSNDHPLYLGMAGLGAPASVRARLDAADALLVIGCRLNEATSYQYQFPGPDTAWMHVDLEPGSAAGIPPPQVSIASDARLFLRAANERLLGGAVLDAGKVAARDLNNAADRATWEAETAIDETPWEGPGVHPGHVIAMLRRVLPDEAILTVDAGNFGSWAARGFRFRRPGTFLGPTSGAMGYGLPAAITAALIHRDRPVVALVGDGGLAMSMAELETAVREGARVIVVVFDNQRYGTIRMWQELRGTGQGVATELGPVDFAAIARACGARGARVEHDSEFEGALRAALAADRPTVIQLTLDQRWVSVDQPA